MQRDSTNKIMYTLVYPKCADESIYFSVRKNVGASPHFSFYRCQLGDWQSCYSFLSFRYFIHFCLFLYLCYVTMWRLMRFPISGATSCFYLGVYSPQGSGDDQCVSRRGVGLRNFWVLSPLAPFQLKDQTHFVLNC